jgi:hypothetical protein
VVSVPGSRSRGPGSIPGATRFFGEVVGLERGPLSLVMIIEELFQGRDTLYPQKLVLNFADKRRSLGRYSSLADQNHGVFFTVIKYFGILKIPGFS